MAYLANEKIQLRYISGSHPATTLHSLCYSLLQTLKKILRGGKLSFDMPIRGNGRIS